MSLWLAMPNATSPRTLAALREWWANSFNEPCPADDELIRMTEGTLARSQIDLQIAIDDLVLAFKEVVAVDWRRIRRLFRR